MKFLCERDGLKDALAAVIGRTKSTSLIPILSHVLLEAKSNVLTLCGNDLDSSSRTRLAAEVTTPGAGAVPADRLSQLIAGMPSGAQVSFSLEGARLSVRAGRSVYGIPTLPADDFPGMLQADGGDKITLTPAQVERIFGVPEPMVSTEETRPYLCGIFLHTVGKALSGVATDGHRLMRTIAPECKVSDFDSVLIPTRACQEFVRLAKQDCEFSLSANIVTLKTGDVEFSTKLIDATFPDYQRVIPQSEISFTFDCKDMDAMLARLETIRDKIKSRPICKMSWLDNPTVATLTVESDAGRGDEQVECDLVERPAGEVGFQVGYLRNIIDAMDCETIRMFIDDPMTPIRIENPADSNVVAVLVPCRI